MQCKLCGSFAINHNSHGRDGSDGDLCDVCYWRTRAEKQDWQPIDTAPKDRAILICDDDGDVMQASWWSSRYSDVENQGWMPANLDEEYSSYVKATHWLPLPSAPKKEKS